MPKNMDFEVIRTVTGVLTKQHLWNYWMMPHVRESIWQQTRRRHIAFHFAHGVGQDPVMRRHLTDGELEKLDTLGFELPCFDDGKPFWQLERDRMPGSGITDDPQDWTYIVNQGLIEVIPEVHDYDVLDKLDYVLVDLDLKGQLRKTHAETQLRLKEIAKECWKVVTDILPTKYAEIRFSGNRSYHLCFWLPIPMEFERARTRVKEALREELEPVLWEEVKKGKRSPDELGDVSVTNTRARDNFVYLDCGSMARHRCVRALGSLHWKSGRPCIRVGLPEKLDIFKVEMATRENVRNYPKLVEYRDKA